MCIRDRSWSNCKRFFTDHVLNTRESNLKIVLAIMPVSYTHLFDRTRAGLNLGEGAGYLVLQSEKSLTKAPYCELSGYANANEAYHQTGSSPDGNGPFLSMSQAIASAGLTAGAIDYINVHGTGTPSNDASEGKAIRRIFDTRIPPFSSVIMLGKVRTSLVIANV